jgi:hypothetical protein
MPSSPLITRFENALIDLIEIYVRDGMSSNDINSVLIARSDDDHFEHILERERALASDEREKS